MSEETARDLWLNPYDAAECTVFQEEAGEGWYRYVFSGIHEDITFEMSQHIAELEAEIAKQKAIIEQYLEEPVEISIKTLWDIVQMRDQRIEELKHELRRYQSTISDVELDLIDEAING